MNRYLIQLPDNLHNVTGCAPRKCIQAKDLNEVLSYFSHYHGPIEILATEQLEETKDLGENINNDLSKDTVWRW